jgi:hypothetical protein
MATTTNYGWTTPDDTALVKDGAAAIRTLGSSVDTTTKNLNPETTLGDIAYRSSTANVNTRLPLGTAGQVLKVNSGATAPEWSSDSVGMTNPMTTTGDTIYSSSGSTPARLGIGTAGQVLKVNSGATAPEWGAAPSAGANWTLLNSGGTALTGASTITVSGISSADKIMVLFGGASSGTASSEMSIRLNTDTGSNYYRFGAYNAYPTTYSTNNFTTDGGSADARYFLASMGSNAAATVSGYAMITGCNAAGVKVIQGVGAATNGGGNNQVHGITGGYYNSSTVISSVSIVSSTGNFDAGTIYVYTSA